MDLAGRLAEERRGRLAAERLLELKQAELRAANRKLGRHAEALSVEIVETRAEVANVRNENQRVKSDLNVAHQKVEVAERRLWHSIQTITDGFAFFDDRSTLIAANDAYLIPFEDLEIIRPGVNYVEILQILTEEGIVNTEDLNPTQWRQKMMARWEEPEPEPTIIRLWNNQYIKVIDRRGIEGDIVSLGLNITASVRYENEISKARDKAEAASRAKSAFLANMSHEIRTPMNGVVGMADLLTDTGLDDEQRLYVETIRNSGEALLSIINDILDFSKIEAERLQLHLEPFDLERCIHEIIMLLQPSAQNKGLKLLIDYDLFLPTQFIGDGGRIRQILTNLIGNAVKFTSEGHVLIRVTGVPSGSDMTSKINIVIEDTGIGISEDHLGHIFGEFNQVENERNRQFDGTGLGLVICKRLVELMGGEIWVTSQEGAGSCFGFTIDMQVPDGEVPQHPILPNGLRDVLIVDDNADNRMILEKQLKQSGLNVTSCKSGFDALEYLKSNICNLILTDHNMPEMDGMEFTQELRDQGNMIPIVLLSSNPSLADNEPARAHLAAVLQKPVPRSELFAMFSAFQATPGLNPEDAADEFADLPETRVMRVLAAEDNKTNQLVLTKMLKDLQIELQIAQNGEEAVEMFQSFAPDMIFMDISMPKMDGKEAARNIRLLEQGTGDHVPIVALTAHALPEDDKEILEAGIDFYMTKPLRKDVLIKKIISLCPPDLIPPLSQEQGVA